ncbi:NIC13 [Auxenochlorella protothecoides x Auxenochlorella symbiontica]
MSQQRIATLATCNLGQWAMDFTGNLDRIIKSIEQARAGGARYRLGPELEIPGYGCEDHFSENDTVEHSWECVARLLAEGHTAGLVVDVGAPVVHRGVRYNCRLFLLDGRVLLIRPKLHLAGDGNYREPRYFSTWKRGAGVEEHTLPGVVRAATGQRTCPFGHAALAFSDAVLASESCEELFTPRAPHIDLALAGVEIITNGSGSHHQMRKLHTRLDLMMSGTAKAGGVYLYANQQGCDGGRLYYDGCAAAVVNGALVAQGAQFSVREVEVVLATVDLDEVVGHRGAVASLREQASAAPPPALVPVDWALCDPQVHSTAALSLPRAPRYLAVEEEIAYGPAAWLWDYLRRSGATGFMLPLSGGADSSATAAIVGSMCRMVCEAAAAGDADVVRDLQRIAKYGDGELPGSPQELAGRIFLTMYLGTENSSETTRGRAAALAAEVGSRHLAINMDAPVKAMVALFAAVTGFVPRFKVQGGSVQENIALQNIQARLRMVVSFLFAQLWPWVGGQGGYYLVLGSANVDEALRGYLTKYDCSSADINPIGGISKTDLKRFLGWAAEHLGFPSLAGISAAPPTAELEPLRDGEIAQTDEADMGMTYEELSLFGNLRKVSRCGPVAMFRSLLSTWRSRYPAPVIADKVKHFFRYYAINRHKATVLTPSYHAENYSPDDNRYDHRQFLYNIRWPWQFARIDALVEEEALMHGREGPKGGQAVSS